MTPAPMLKHDGQLIEDFTVANQGDGEWFTVGTGIAEDYHMRWFRQQISDGEQVNVRPYGMTLMGISIAGPRARKVLAAVTDEDVSAEGLRFMDIRHQSIGMAKALVGRVSFTGDLGYEIWTKPEDLRHVYDVLMAAGEPHGIRLFGLPALKSLRLEKNYGGWAREYRPIYTFFEAELGYFVALDKSTDFIGKAAAVEAHDNKGGPMRLHGFVVDVQDADVIGDEPIYLEGKVCGWVTSGGYVHHSELSMAMGYVPRDVADTQTGWEVEILGER